MRWFIIVILVILLIPFDLSIALDTPPSSYIDEGACPGEGCVYGRWKALRNTDVYSEPDKKSEIIGRIKAGDYVDAETGFVHTIPGKFNVTTNHKHYKTGDVIYLYTYRGEGYFKVWYNGNFYDDEEFGFSYWDDIKKDDWGYVEKTLDSTWWVKIKSHEGLKGWILRKDNFCSLRDC